MQELAMFPDRLTWGVLRQGLSRAHVFFLLAADPRLEPASLCGRRSPHPLTFGRAPGPAPRSLILEDAGLKKVGSISLRRRVAATSVHDRHLPGSGRPTWGRPADWVDSTIGVGPRSIP
jgi:hypothetical protein